MMFPKARKPHAGGGHKKCVGKRDPLVEDVEELAAEDGPEVVSDAGARGRP